MRIDANITKMFFNQKAVMDAVGKSRAKTLGRAGYKVQQAAKSLLVFKPPIKRPKYSRVPAIRAYQVREYFARKKADASQPGQVPFVRRKNYPNLRSVIYAYDATTGAVIVGPIVRRKRSSARPSPGVHERGGSVTINVKTKSGIKPMTARYSPRPIMGPSLRKAVPEIPSVLANSVVP